MRNGLERGVDATDDARHGDRQRRRAGHPQGEEAAKQLSDWADSSHDDLEAAQDSLDEEADTLEDAIKQLTGAADALRRSSRPA